MYESIQGLQGTEAGSESVATWTEPNFRATWLRWNPDADDCAHSLYRPDCVAPELSFDRLRMPAAPSGERRLCLAILEDAVNCFQKHIFATRPRHRRLQREAETWLFGEFRGAPSDGAFSFDYICDALGIERDALRRSLVRWRERQIAERAHQPRRPTVTKPVPVIEREAA